MPTFLDESGDAGVGEKSAPFFRLAAVWFETVDQAEACREAIATLRKDTLGLKRGFEFKSVKTPPRYLQAFLELVATHPFRFVVCSVEKKAATDVIWTKEAIYRAAVRAVADRLHATYLSAETDKGAPLNERVLADRTDDAMYLRELRTGFSELRSGHNPKAALVKSVKLGNSHADDLIQLADVVCGSVGRHLQGDSGDFRMVRDRLLDVIVVTRNEERERPEPPAS